MKNRYYPRVFTFKKMLIALSVIITLLLISIIVVLIVKNEYLSILLPLPFALATVHCISISIVNAFLSKKKYEIKYNKMISYEPLKAPKEIDISPINSIYVVIHTIDGGRGVISGLPIRNVKERRKYVYNVILFKEGYPEQYLHRDASDSILDNVFLKDYILYDFDYDRDTVLSLLEETNADIYTNETMYNEMRNDIFFSAYLDRIKLKKLAGILS